MQVFSWEGVKQLLRESVRGFMERRVVPYLKLQEYLGNKHLEKRERGHQESLQLCGLQYSTVCVMFQFIWSKAGSYD